MNSDFRALCAAMSSWWGLLALPEWARPQDQAEFDELGRQARAALAAEPAEPAGEVPSERDVAEWINSLPLWHGASRDELSGIVLRALARWGRPATPPAPEVGEVGEVAAWLENHAAHLRKMQEIGAWPETELQEMLDRAATLLQQQAAPAPEVVPVAVSERPWERPGWLDREGRCWFLSSRFSTWSLDSPPVALTRGIGRCLSLPVHAIPLPQAGEGEA